MNTTSRAQTATPLRIAIIGAGRVGPVLGAAFRQVGHIITACTARTEASQDRVGALLPEVPIRPVKDVGQGADIVIIAVPDDALPAVVEELPARSGQIVAHTSGAHGLAVLAPLADAGALPLALHPAQTFSGTSLDIARLQGCPFAVTAPPALLPLAHALIADLGGQPITLADADRPAYHAALSHGANHAVTLIAQARRILADIGQVDPGATLRPLVTTAVDAALRSGDSALTGPVLRGDAGTIRAHLEILGELGEPDIETTYRHMALTTAQRCGQRQVLDETAIAEVTDAIRPALQVCTTKAELAAALAVRPGRRAVVMTMGALHEGHLTLVRRARELADVVVVTDFVNPLQFGPGEDYEAYPRDLAADVELLRGEGVDVVFAPSVEEMYPREPLVRVDPGEVATQYEGVTRPTHFAGVVQVVLKLLHLTGPDYAIFGEKDAQQLALIKAMVDDLDVPVQIVGVPIARAEDGVALSSRNTYLSAEEREQARALSASLRAAQQAIAAVPADHPERASACAAAATEAARTFLEDAPGVRVDYCAAVDARTYYPPTPETAELIVAVAAWLGTTRLIDNCRVEL